MGRARTGVALVALMALAACHRGGKPGGQVVATVDGEEITLGEVNTELGSTPIPPGIDKQTAQRQLLQRVIERKLIDNIATKRGIASSPEYLAQKRRTDEILLAQTYARQQLAAVQVPTQADIAKFMADNPGAFADRQQLTLDQIRFATPTSPTQLKGLEAVHTMEGVAAFLTQKGIKFVHTPASLDTAAIPPGLLKAIDGVKPGEPFVIPTGPTVTINVVTGRKPIANDPAQAQTAAVNAWRQQKVQQLVTDQLKSARDAAKISYQPGFAPPAPGARAATTASATK